MLDALFQMAERLSSERVPYALAIVVRHEQPISGKAGDKAIVLADGQLTGWIGGGCTKPLIIAEARKALDDGQHRLVRITPDSESGAKGIITHTMTCHSGGALDIYIEPVMPKPQLVIIGRTELARVLCRLASNMKYHVTVIAPDANPASFEDATQFQTDLSLSQVNLAGPTFVVVATQGDHDIEALREVLSHDLGYIAFVASKRKAAAVLETLAGTGIATHELERIQTPAGLDIGARLPEEIALSILAQIVASYRSTRQMPSTNETVPTARETIHIEGMSCGHCVLTVRNALESIGGVQVHNVQVGRADVSFGDSGACREDAVRALDQVGFAARLESGE